MKGEAVADLQRLLYINGFAVTVDGCFGKQTEKALRTFQAAAGLPGDGIYGPQSKAALESAMRLANPLPQIWTWLKRLWLKLFKSI